MVGLYHRCGVSSHGGTGFCCKRREGLRGVARTIWTDDVREGGHRVDAWKYVASVDRDDGSLLFDLFRALSVSPAPFPTAQQQALVDVDPKPSLLVAAAGSISTVLHLSLRRCFCQRPRSKRSRTLQRDLFGNRYIGETAERESLCSLESALGVDIQMICDLINIGKLGPIDMGRTGSPDRISLTKQYQA